MRQKYGVFAEASGELRLIHAGSVRFSRANRFALKADKSYPGVFFAHYQRVEDTPTINAKGETVSLFHFEPVGERHKPKHIEKPDWSRRPERPTDFIKAEKVESKPDTRKRRPKRRNPINYNEVDPQTGETLGDVLIDMYRERLLREARNV